MRYKYPRTYHLPFSPGLQNDDRLIETLGGLIGQEVIVTEKMDGENSSLYRDGFHARSLDSRHHASRDWLKKFHGEIAYKIPGGWRICGENMFAMHSIYYSDLLSYFYGFSIWDDRNVALSIDDQNYWFHELGIVQPKTFYKGIFNLKVLHDLADSLDPIHQEGFVVRVTGEIPFEDFGTKLAKWVRKGHVQTDEHWMSKPIIQNTLRSER
jgi:hypothetical protein